MSSSSESDTEAVVEGPSEESTFEELVCLLLFTKTFNIKTKQSCGCLCFMICAFQGIVEALCLACEQVKWKVPTPIQRQAVPLALQGAFFQP